MLDLPSAVPGSCVRSACAVSKHQDVWLHMRLTFGRDLHEQHERAYLMTIWGQNMHRVKNASVLKYK